MLSLHARTFSACAFLIALLALAFALVAFSSAFDAASVLAQEVDASCSDGLDNDEDGLVDADDPNCTGLTEEPVRTVSATEPATEAPTEAATEAPATDVATAAPTDAPAASATPTELPDTGGDPNQQDGDDPDGPNGNELAFQEWVIQTGIIGAIVGFIITALLATGLTLTAGVKRLLALALSVVVSVIYIATKDNLAIESLEDVTSTTITVLIASQAAYLLISQQLQGAIVERQQRNE